MFVELKETRYQVFEVPDGTTYDDVATMYANGTLLMDNPHTFYLDAQLVSKKEELNGNYEDITDL